MKKQTYIKEEILLEHMTDILSYFKRMRQKTDHPKARAFFNDVKNIKNYSEDGLKEAVKIFNKHISKEDVKNALIEKGLTPTLFDLEDQQEIDSTYEELQIKTTEYAIDVFELSIELFEHENKIKKTTYNVERYSFYIAIAYLYSNLILLNEYFIEKSFQKFIEHLKKTLSAPSWWIYAKIILILLILLISNLPIMVMGISLVVFVLIGIFVEKQFDEKEKEQDVIANQALNDLSDKGDMI